MTLLTAQVAATPQRSPSRRAWRLIPRILLLSVVIALIVGVGFGFFLVAYGSTDRSRPADVIIVLGSGVRLDGLPSIAGSRRVRHGVELYKRGFAPYLLCTGSVNRYSRNRVSSDSEAGACRTLAIQLGVPTQAILIEEVSTSTEENAIESVRVMRENDLKSAIVVSNHYHLFRGQWLFRNYGLDVTTSPAEMTQTPLTFGTTLRSTGREVFAVGWQVIKSVFGITQTATPF